MASKVDSGPLRSGCLRDSGVWPESLSDANIFESKWCSLRNQSHAHSGPIIALTANAMSIDRQRCLEVGCNEYASKPISRQELLRLVAQYAAKSRAFVHAREE